MSESEELIKAREKKEKLEKSKFKQQTLPAWRPVPTLVSSLITFLVFGVIFLTLGIILIEFSNDIKDEVIRYDKKWGDTDPCDVTITVHDKMDGPVYVYYELHNFYQNHRKYVRSRDLEQLRGSVKSVSELDEWEPIKTNKDAGVTESYGGSPLDEDGPANPCGLIAKSVFTDKFKLFDSSDNRISIDESNISWDSDREHKFKRPKNSKEIQWIDPKDEHFIVRMRTAGMPNFRKLWGKIDQDLPKGQYKIEIENKYDVSPFDGKKKFVLSTTNAFGGKNYFLGIWYWVVGSLCFVFAIIFIIAYFWQQKQRKKED